MIVDFATDLLETQALEKAQVQQHLIQLEIITNTKP